MRSVVALLMLCALGCGTDDDTPPIEPAQRNCVAGEWRRDDGVCVPAGLPPDMPCPPGEWLRDGVCTPAGVPADGCGQGFAHDGDRGCEPILPEAPCPLGLMAVPGETMCRAVAACASGRWGDIPVEPDTEYVDGSYAGLDSDGSALKPWSTIQAAVDAASPGAIVAIAAGSYVEVVTVSGKPVRLWGVCPSLAEVVGTGAQLATLLVLSGATGTEVRNIALRGDADGVGVSGSRNVLLERVWSHANTSEGINIENDLGATHVTLRASLLEKNRGFGVLMVGAMVTVEASVIRETASQTQSLSAGIAAAAPPGTGDPSMLAIRGSLLEQNYDNGVFVRGSEATVEASVIRDTQADPQSEYGRGVEVQADPPTAAPSTLALRASLLERNRNTALFVAGSEATVEASVIRDTHPDAQGLFGRGVELQAHETTGAPSRLTLRASLLERNRSSTVAVIGSDATVEASVVRDTQLDEPGLFGRGISARPDSTTGAPSTVSLRTSLLERNYDVGVFVEGSAATVEASIVRDTLPDAQGLGGRGVNVQEDATTGAPSTLLLRASLLEHNHELGLHLSGSEGSLDSSVLRNTLLDADGISGRGINVQEHAMTGAASTLTLARSVIEHSREGGVFIIGSIASIDACVVRDSLPDAQGRFGVGVVIAAEPTPGRATITATRIERSELAAVAAWGAHTAIGGSALVCQRLDIDHETYQQKPATLEDLGGNRCGCPEPTGECRAVSANLEPPPPLEPEKP